jgi:2-polyprenyl-3-methyl-5-hydroxy-6-metoxy-1,4-benzoquinol methylase
MTSLPASAAYYDRHAAGHAARHASVRFEDVHAQIIGTLPALPASVLDVGAGMGRDAAALAGRGYEVTAVEPSRELQRQGRDLYGDRAIEWIEDRLPGLQTLRAAHRRFDFILCSAVLMHIAPADLADSFRTFAELLKPGACLAISVRNKLARDPDEIFFNICDAEICEGASLAGLHLSSRHASDDALGRDEVRWRSFQFVR